MRNVRTKGSHPSGAFDPASLLELNLAQSAIKMGEWNIAKVACEYVLKADAAHPKALYRLAQAYDGAGDTAKVQSTLAGLLKLEGQENNRDARKLLADVKSAAVASAMGFRAPADLRIKGRLLLPLTIIISGFG